MHKKIVSNLFLIEIQLIYNVVLVSGAQQSDSIIYIYTHKYTTHTHTHTHILIYIQILSHCRLIQILNIDPCAMCYIVGPCCLSVLCRIVSHLLLSQTIVQCLHLRRPLCTCVFIFIRKTAISGFIGSKDLSPLCPVVRKEIFRCENSFPIKNIL